MHARMHRITHTRPGFANRRLQEAIEIAEEFRRENRSKLENMVSDSVFGVVFMFVFFRDTVGECALSVSAVERRKRDMLAHVMRWCTH